jgi:hypothetical protein
MVSQGNCPLIHQYYFDILCKNHNIIEFLIMVKRAFLAQKVTVTFLPGFAGYDENFHCLKTLICLFDRFVAGISFGSEGHSLLSSLEPTGAGTGTHWDSIWRKKGHERSSA